MFFMPIRIIMFYSITIILIIILILNINNIIYYIDRFNIDLISLRIILLRFYILILIKLRQFISYFFKSLFFIFLMLNLRLIFSFSTNNIIMFYFFFWMIVNSNFFYYSWLRISDRTNKIKILFIDIYFICFITLINIYYYSNKSIQLFIYELYLFKFFIV